MTTSRPITTVDASAMFQSGEYRLRLEQCSEAIFRVRVTQRDFFLENQSLMILNQAVREPTWCIRESADTITLKAKRLSVQVDRQSLSLTWFDGDGHPLVREPDREAKQLAPILIERSLFDDRASLTEDRTADGIKARVDVVHKIEDRWAYSTKTQFVFAEGEAIYGLGQHEEGILNYRGKSQYLYQQNMKVAMPAIVSTRGYGVLWDTSSLAAFHDDEHGSYFWTEMDDELDFYFVAGPEFDEIVAGFRYLTGKPTMLPLWAYGYVQSKERYKTQDELVEIVKEHRKRQIPLDCIVLDWQSWAGDGWGQKTLDPVRFPDPDTLTSELHALGAKLMVSVWPTMRNGCPDQVQMSEQGCLLGDRFTYDAFNPKARSLYWKQANDGLFRHGIDGWWCDCTEPFESDWSGTVKPEPWKRVFLNSEETKKYLDPGKITAYSMWHSKGIYEGQRATTNGKRVINLTRSGYMGQQRYGTITWAGDTAATWKTLRRQIPDGLNFCVTGNPRWTFDIGGFFTDRKHQWFWKGDFPQGVSDLGYRELYVRWFQIGAFMPFFRSHGTDTPREVWRFGNPGEPFFDALCRALNLRYRLLPYIYSSAAAECLEDRTLVRMLAFDFRHDPDTFDVGDQFLFGRSLMVCPVMEPTLFGPESSPIVDPPLYRTVYLPLGTDWYDFWSGKRWAGGKTICVEIELDRIPIFVRAGAIVPLGPEKQFTGETSANPIELWIYPGADSESLFYEDDGDGYGYEAGEFVIRRFSWCDASQTLIAETEGVEAPKFNVTRKFLVRLKSAEPESGEVLSATVELRAELRYETFSLKHSD
ncbi:MAG: glycoside hydrolase family 31 protein [Fimbriimonas sp.]|nr:glycoside hydrolase family 31 protein [Fimbriimonas sp.]